LIHFYKRLLKVNPRYSDFPVESCKAFSSTSTRAAAGADLHAIYF